jgi:hypothetical protein
MLVSRLSEAPAEEWHRLRYRALMDAGQLGARNMSVTWLMSVAGDTQDVAEGDLILVPPATDHSIANNGGAELACVSVQSPPVAAAELYSDQLAEVSGYDDEDL